GEVPVVRGRLAVGEVAEQRPDRLLGQRPGEVDQVGPPRVASVRHLEVPITVAISAQPPPRKPSRRTTAPRPTTDPQIAQSGRHEPSASTRTPRRGGSTTDPPKIQTRASPETCPTFPGPAASATKP